MKRTTRLKIVKWTILLPTLLVGLGVALYLIPTREWVRSTGYVTTDRSAHVRPRTEGPIKEILVHYGQRVQKGQLLVRLEDDIQQSNLAKAQSALQVARDRLERARKDQLAEIQRHKSLIDEKRIALEEAKRRVAREESLVKSGASTQKVLDDLKARQQEAAAQLRTVQVQLDEASMAAELVVMRSQVDLAAAEVKVMESELELRRVKSPLAGVVLLNKFVPGEVVEKKQILGEVFDDSEYIAKVKVSERHLRKIRGPLSVYADGKKVREDPGEEVWVEVAAYPHYHYGYLTGRVAYQPLVVTPQRTGDGVVLLYVHFDFYPPEGADGKALPEKKIEQRRIWAEGPNRRFVPGQTVEAEILVGETNVLFWLLGIETN